MDSPQQISAAHNLHWLGHASGDDSSFEFAFASPNPTSGQHSITADEIFSDGQLLPVYTRRHDSPYSKENSNGKGTPLWRLFSSAKEVESIDSEETDSDELEGLPEGSYCIWAPDWCRKSASTGSVLPRRRRLRELIVKRSRSEGKEKFAFLERVAPERAALRRLFLPYRKEIVGIFGCTRELCIQT